MMEIRNGLVFDAAVNSRRELLPVTLFQSPEVVRLLQNLPAGEVVAVTHQHLGEGTLVLRQDDQGFVVKARFGNALKIIDADLLRAMQLDLVKSGSSARDFFARVNTVPARTSPNVPVDTGADYREATAFDRAVQAAMAGYAQSYEARGGEEQNLVLRLVDNLENIAKDKILSPVNANEDGFIVPCTFVQRGVIFGLLQAKFGEPVYTPAGMCFSGNQLAVVLRRALKQAGQESTISALEDGDSVGKKIGPFAVVLPLNNLTEVQIYSYNGCQRLVRK